MKTVTALALISLTVAAPAWAITKSHTSSVTQNNATQSWTQKCTVKAKGVSLTKSYWGDVWVRYNDPNGEEEFVRRFYSLTPALPNFTEVSTGLYSITASMTAENGIVVTVSATRYGPLTAAYNDYGVLIGYGGTFTCSASILRGTSASGTWNSVHHIRLEERVGHAQ